MKGKTVHLLRRSLVLAVLLLAPACAHQQANTSLPTGGEALAHTTTAERGTFGGGDDCFTGQATVAMLFSSNGSRDFGGATVAFEPGARTVWHSHPAGQTLLITEGTGWVQLEGQRRLVVSPGDVVWTPPGVRHWHGATPSTEMTHIAIQGELDGRTVDWFEPVSDAQYESPDQRASP